MEWLMVSVLMCLAGLGEGGALKCMPGIDDSSCAIEELEKVQPSQLAKAGETDPAPAEAECLPGSEWESNCHYCTCSADGVARCLQQGDCSEPSAEPIRCKPNTTFSRECNTCLCLQNGLGLCTLKSCRISSIPTESNLPAGKECAMGSEWRNRCNRCFCSPSGIPACTEMACSDDGTTPYRDMRCAPDTVWKNRCNTCWCTNDGLPACTKKGCLDLTDIISTETPKDNAVSPDAAIKSYTNKTHKVVCVANRMFIRDCNTCWCNDDGTGFFCTRKVCVQELPEETGPDEEKPEDLRVIKKECRPDEVFEIDCNMCRCNPDGKSFSCTRRACVEQVDEDVKNSSLSRKTRNTSKEAPKACQPGQEFRLDCNKCLCDNEGQDFSCTRNDCNAQNNHNGGSRSKRDTSEQVTTECSPGSVFDRDCNVCRCTADGHHAMCTMKRCSNPNEEKDMPAPESDPNFRCNPGEQFKRGCNDCSCSADGKSVFCTVRYCDQDITPPPSL